jgi:heat-inducible transcriptional repressor
MLSIIVKRHYIGYIPDMIIELSKRSQEIFQNIVDSYLTTGIPVGSKTISERLETRLSSASVRNVMADLEATGLLFSPHTSAGRIPTQMGLRLYIDGLMKVGDLTEQERHHIDSECETIGQSIAQTLERASLLLSGLSECAGIVAVPKTNKALKQIQFVKIEDRKVLAILVTKDGMVENRVLELSNPVSSTALIMASNYLNDHLNGRTIEQAQKAISREMNENRIELDDITRQLVQRGLALPSEQTKEHIIIRGQSKLLQDVTAIEDLEKARQLLSALSEQETIIKLLESTGEAGGIQVFIGAENKMFEHSGWSMVVSPYKTEENDIIGAIGVIGPTRIDYGRIIPIVDYTSQVISKIIAS